MSEKESLLGRLIVETTGDPSMINAIAYAIEVIYPIVKE